MGRERKGSSVPVGTLTALPEICQFFPRLPPPSFPPSLLPVQAARPSLITPAHSFLFSPKVVILTPVGKTSRRAPRGWGRESTWGQAACRADPQDLAGRGGVSLTLCGLGC